VKPFMKLELSGLKFFISGDSRARLNEAPRSKLRGITELNFEDFSEAEANPVASYGESQVENREDTSALAESDLGTEKKGTAAL
jgi:hypothetical protein